MAGWDVDKFLDHVEAGALPGSIAAMQGNKKVADRFGLKLIGYEAGQHFVGIRGAENDAALTALLHAANTHRRIGSIYEKYYASWQAAGGDLLCHFSSVGTWSKWGTWGLLENADEPPAASPKFVTTMAWGKSLGQKVMQP